jgi:DNA-binding CsgD family transcriptional regulator/Tol biopolymer transport system component
VIDDTPHTRLDRLTPRQRDVLALLRRGLTNAEIARELGISPDGAKWHVSEIISCLGVRDRYEAAALATPAPRRWWGALAAPFAGVRRAAAPIAYALGAIVIVAAAAGVALLLWGVTRDSAGGRGGFRADGAGPLGKVAYVRDGDIWVKWLPDGPDRRILEGPASTPRWSPSGDWILVASGDQDEQVIRADGSDRNGVGAEPVWAPGADEIAYVGDDGAIVVERADGSGRRTIVPAPDNQDERTERAALRWNPAGNTIAYSEQRTNDATPPWTYAGIWVSPADGSGAREVYNTGAPPTDGLFPIGWTPNGAQIVFALAPGFLADVVDGLPIYEVPVAGGEPRQLVPAMLLGEELWSPSPLRKLYFAISGAGREMWRNKSVSIISWASGTGSALTDPSTAAFAPSWSPDGQQLAYVALPDAGVIGGSGIELEAQTRERHIWTVSAYDPVSGTDKRQITDDPNYRDERPQWASDGATILFARIDQDYNTSLWTVPAGGGAPLQVVDAISGSPGISNQDLFTGYYGQVSWSRFFDWWQPSFRDTAISTPAALVSWTNADLGVTLNYPADWITDAAPMLGSCVDCLIFGPASAPYPYGIDLFSVPSLDMGCVPAKFSPCYFSIRALALDPPRELTIAGHRALEQEIERQAPLGLAAETGDYTSYHQLATFVFRDTDTLIIDGFWRDGDVLGEAAVRGAYQAMLDSLTFITSPLGPINTFPA